MEIHSIRKEYSLKQLEEKDVNNNPILQFKKWLEEAIIAQVDEPTAMVLSTVSKEGFPESRIVLLKGVEKNGLTFFTNYKSNKGIQILKNNKVSLTFFWPQIQRQIRIKGLASKVGRIISDHYFASRPDSSKIGAWTSNQSSVIESRERLEEVYKYNIEKFMGKEIPCPKHWGGFIVHPISFEFWQGRENRLHDRIYYEYIENRWEIKRLAP